MANRAQRAWNRIEAPSDGLVRQVQTAANVEIVGANRADTCLLPLYHPIDAWYAHDDVDLPPLGGPGTASLQYDDVVKRGSSVRMGPTMRHRYGRAIDVPREADAG